MNNALLAPSCIPGLLEKIPTRIFDTAQNASQIVAQEIAELINQRERENRPCVLSLATGSTPVGVYKELIRLHQNEGLSFKNVITFNLDEYYPMNPDDLQSYHRFMNEHLFDHIDIHQDNIHIPSGTVAADKVLAHCKDYEKAIDELGGLDLQILGIGRTGHIGFNEPGSGPNSLTRLITLDRVTRMDAAGDFDNEQSVPRRAITMGVGSVFKARRVILMAWGEHKAPIIAQAVEGKITSAVAASFLQDHPDAEIILDQAASAQLARNQTPWLVGAVDWNQKLIRRAVLWMAQKVGKPILKLTDEDYNEWGLQDLLAAYGSAYDINVQVFRIMQHTITGWPGGKPTHAKQIGDATRPHDEIFPKRCIVFSPHPDDDVISMGGTLIRLADHGHEVHVAYQVSGNIAVFDDDALRFADFAAEMNHLFNIDSEKSHQLEKAITNSLTNKKPGQMDSEEVRKIKGLIRRSEAKAAGRYCGVPVENLHFLDLPFYETGRVDKNVLGDEDIRIIREMLEKIKPHQIYAAGDLSDPHGTHRVCLQAILKAVDQVKDQDWFANCAIWLYRGAWQEWGVQDIDMAVPISPVELIRKRNAIFKHESQKDKALFPGTDPREFWKRAEDRNRGTAKIYDQLGLAEYEGIEAFVRWTDDIQA